VLLLLLLLFQQQPPPPTETIPDAAPPPFEDKRDRGQMEGQNRPQGVSVSGSIAAEDRKPLPDNAWVQAFCNGSAGQGIFTRDRFRLPLGGGFGMAPPPGQTNTASGLAGCEIRVQLSGFLPATAPVNVSGPMGAEIGVIVLRSRSDVTGYSYSLTSALAPKEARKAYEKGVQNANRNRLDPARKELEAAVAAYPKYSAAWFELGAVLHRMNDAPAARNAYQRSIESDPQFLRPVLQLAMMAAGERNWPETILLTERVLARNRFEFPQAFLYHAAASYNLGDLAAAEKSVRRAIELDAPHRLPKAFQLLSAILAARQDYAAAADNLRLYLKHAPGAADSRELQAQLADLEARATGARPGPAPRTPFTAVAIQ
jgi:Tfp pilus assembly protein PilF